MPLPNQLPKLNFEGIDPTFQQWLNQLCDTVNSHSGFNGPVQLANHLDMGGFKVQNIGAPASPTDALASGVAEAKYSAPALAPQLKPGSKNAMVGYRQINNKNQREQSSSWLNSLLSTPPNSNTINPIVTSSGGSTSVTIPASIVQMGDGSTRYLPSRTDVLTNPASYTITTFTVSGGVATVNLGSTPAPPFTDSTVVYISGTGQIDGTFPVASIVTPTQFKINVTSGVSGTGGTVATGGTYYYYLNNAYAKVMLAILPSSSDTPFNRLGISGDGFQLLAVVSINSSGYVQVGTAGGGTPTATTTANSGSRF